MWSYITFLVKSRKFKMFYNNKDNKYDFNHIEIIFINKS